MAPSENLLDTLNVTPGCGVNCINPSSDSEAVYFSLYFPRLRLGKYKLKFTASSSEEGFIH